MIEGKLILGARNVAGRGAAIGALNPSSDAVLPPLFHSADDSQVEEACALAWAAFDGFRGAEPETRAGFLESIAANIVAIGDLLVERAMAETGLPEARIRGERDRTVGQLRLFAQVVRTGRYLDLRVDPAMPDRKPLPRPDLRSRMIPLGPVAVFGASNFPLAFSVAGGDTASALAAGCPVVVKAHSAHPGTSELVGRAIQQAAGSCGLPEGVFSLLFDSGYAIGAALVRNRHIKAVGFTGSRSGGLTLMDIARQRPEPIPVFAEMSSINPVILFGGALERRAAAIGEAFVASLLMGAGQFCTGPGLVLAVEGEGLDNFINAAASSLKEAAPATMLTAGIAKAYEAGVGALASNPSVETVARGKSGGCNQCVAGLFVTSGSAFLENGSLSDEIFGSSSLIVRCADETQLTRIVEQLEGQLTASLHIEESDHGAAGALLPVLEHKVGRILVNGFGTGVEVAHAMVHGGPFPATSDGRSTSVGTMAIERFTRPVCYQNFPEALLPEDLKDSSTRGFDRLVDGKPLRSA